jgi:hypothetical protein
MFGLQASIIRLGDVLNEASKYEDQTAPQDAATVGMAQALKLLQERDDGLSHDEQVNIISLFIENTATVDAYLAIEGDSLRRAWMKSMLLDVNAGSISSTPGIE